MASSPHLLIQALLRETIKRTPVWMMRQAGRYLPEYRRVRSKAGDFLTLCKTPKLACEVTLQPLKHFDLDAAIIFSDILVVPDALGLGLYFVEGEGPKFRNPLKTVADIKKLPILDPSTDLPYVSETIALCRRELKDELPLIGFSGSPWTLACYMLQGGKSREFPEIKRWLYSHPKVLHELLDRLILSITAHLWAQVVAGAQVLMIFDTWGGLLTPSAYREFSLDPITKIISDLKAVIRSPKVPIVLFTKGGGLWLEEISKSGCDGIGLDWTIDIGVARQRLKNKVSLQGNMDPAVLFGATARIRQEVYTILSSYGYGTGHVFNLGHGISQHTSVEKVKTFIAAVHELSPAFHKSALFEQENGAGSHYIES